MIKINKQGNALKIEFTDNDKYLNEGVMEIAPNELMVVVDSSDMATFKRVTNGDVLFSQTIDKIQIAGSAVTKDSILGAFASIGYTTGGGGGGTGAVSSINGQTGDVVLTADSLGVYTKAEVDTKINGLNDKVTNAVDVAGGAAQLADDVDESLKSHIRDFNSYKEEVRDELAGKQPVGEYATKSELSGEVTSLNESINKKANTDYVDGELAKKADKTQLDAYQLKGDYALKSDLTKYFDNAKYEDKRINFYNGLTVVAWIDATPFIKDGMVIDAKIEDGYLVITFNSDAELEPIKIPITDIFNPDNYYTVTIIDEKLAEKVSNTDFNAYKEEVSSNLDKKLDKGQYETDKETFLTKTEAGQKYQPVGDYVTGEKLNTELSSKADKSELVGLASKTDVEEKIDEKLADYYDKTEVDEAIEDAIPDLSDFVTDSELSDYTYDKKTIDEKVAQGGTFDPTNYYDKSDVDGLLKDKADKTELQGLASESYVNGKITDLNISQYETKENASATYQPKGDYLTEVPAEYAKSADVTKEIGQAVSEVESKIPSLNGYATEEWVEGKHYLTEHQSLENYYNKSEVDNKVKEVDDKIPSLEGYATEQWVENKGYLTDIPEEYAKKSDIPSIEGLATKAEVEKKQDKLQGQYIDSVKQEGSSISFKNKYFGMTNESDQPINFKTIGGQSIFGEGDIPVSGGGTVDAYTKTEADNKFATKSQLNNKAPLPSVYNLSGQIQYDYVGQQGNSLTYGTQISYNQINLGDIFDDGNYRSIVVSKGEKDGNYIVQLMPFHTNNPYSSNKGTMLGYQIVFSDPSQETNSLDIFGLGIDGFAPKTIKARSSSFSSLTNATSPSASITISSGSIQYNSVNIGDYLEITNSSSSTEILTLQVIGKYRSGSSYYVIFSGYANVQLYRYTETTSSTKTLTKYINFDPRNLSNIFMGQGITEMGSNNVSIGAYSGVQNEYGQEISYGVAIGAGAMAQGNSAIAIGAYGATASGDYSTAIGAQSGAKDATVIGSNLHNNAGEKVVIGHNYNTYFDVDSSEVARVREGGVMKQIATKSDITGKQDTLKSGTNIKTINGESILGSGNIEISGGGDVDAYTKAEADERFAEKDSVPTVQTSAVGNENNYVYNDNYPKATNGKAVISYVGFEQNSRESDKLLFRYATWNDTSRVAAIPNATQTIGGCMSAADKAKLDSLSSPKIWEGTVESWSWEGINYITLQEKGHTLGDFSIGDILYITRTGSNFWTKLLVTDITSSYGDYWVHFSGGNKVNNTISFRCSGTSNTPIDELNLFTDVTYTKATIDSTFIRLDKIQVVTQEEYDSSPKTAGVLYLIKEG